MQTKDQPKRGRPSKYSPEIVEKIWEQLFDGKSLRAICAEPQMPAKATVCRWLARDQEFRREYVDARDWAEQCLLEQMIDVADGANQTNINRVEREIGALAMSLGRMAPKKYRD